MNSRKPESSRRRVVAHYGSHADEYQARWSSYLEWSIGLTLSDWIPNARDRVLDIGCGTGLLLQRLWTRHPSLRLYGCDPTPQMLAVARHQLPSDVQLLRASAERLPFRTDTFDRIVSSSVLHYLPDPERMLSEAARVLRPGGTMVLTDWCRDYLTMKLFDLHMRRTNPAHVRTHSGAELKRFLVRAGFRTLDLRRERRGWFWGLMRFVAAVDVPSSDRPSNQHVPEGP